MIYIGTTLDGELEERLLRYLRKRFESTTRWRGIRSEIIREALQEWLD